MKPVKMKKITATDKLRFTNYLGNFTSENEAKRYETLLQMQELGLITGLQNRVSFILLDAVKVYKYQRVSMKTKTKLVKRKVSAESPVTFEVSFVYHNKKGHLRVEVVKPCKDYRDPAYVIKRKLMRYLHNIVVIETT